ncbi:MucR family transcriptional regulator [Methylobacterium sp. NEAU 140]|uniref:MucR family transcriptional regulator n=1 Tax=Methylobacterium sp. NEAU 140 TaxID=3064945 RepID=UPI002733C751|nr:MucR family transcriptional regulator [Methylobacterium sp. NEAU 140]MDP4022049.1 MucR family transcriptional regulator [Methylobacterium sp. NEAU 140]
MAENSTVEPVVDDRTVELTADLVAAYVANNSVPVLELAGLIASTHAALKGLEHGASAEPQIDKPSPTQIRKSITPEALISFVDGKPYKTLKRHLTGHGLTLEEYRERYGLPRDYPSVAASYSEARSNLAKSAGLGIGRRNAAPKQAAVAEKIAEPPKAAEAASKPTRARKPKKAPDAAGAE